ncbi:hypothetical protein J2X46_001497 [Nocardioides sp. BE266]|uniref:DUF7144 family membrane protein n=1 Tax=Nocardioides sp. BE266 TaxID=2817725 RepID=UPI00285B8A37|nr:hypothetical protein [Nocardioides sp. BE266]MDR7252521.1 hypothetical protein [Nocardioides sp. BE266]
MSHTTTSADQSDRSFAWAFGISVFAAAMLVMSGVLQALEGLSAILADEIYVGGPSYFLTLDLTAWGWFHLVLGIVAAGIGAAILAGRTWAVAGGIVIGCLAVMAHFLFIPQYPWWSIVAIAFNLLIIWSLCTRVDRDHTLT